MNTAVVFLCFAVVATHAFSIEQDISAAKPLDYYIKQVAKSSYNDNKVYCFAERCTACKNSFANEPLATYDCSGKCGLCALCKGADDVPDCKRWCTVGEDECLGNCLKGKAICTACSSKCELA